MEERGEITKGCHNEHAVSENQLTTYPLRLVRLFTMSKGIVGCSAIRASYQKKTKKPTMAVHKGIRPHGIIGEFDSATTKRLEPPMIIRLPLMGH